MDRPWNAPKLINNSWQRQQQQQQQQRQQTQQQSFNRELTGPRRKRVKFDRYISSFLK